MENIYLCLLTRRSVQIAIMTFFTSEYECKLDAKGRLVLPAKIKNNLPEVSGAEMVLGRGFDQCLTLYSQVEFNKIYSQIAGLSGFNEENRRLQRTFFMGISSIELDANGRFMIPKPLLKYADLDKEVTVVGMGNHIEIWNPDIYHSYLINDPKEFNDLAKNKLDE